MALKLPYGLYGLIDDQLRPDVSVLQKARWVLEGGAAVIQLRLKTTSDRDALRVIRQVVAEAGPVPVVINDRADLCLLGGAAGVHLGDDDLPVDVVRSLVGEAALVGRTCRTLADMTRAKSLGADYVGLGPLFATQTKSLSVPALGLEAFTGLVRSSPLPVVGIGGIRLEDVAAVARAQARCSAVASALLEASNVVERANQLHTQFQSGRTGLGE